MIEVAGWSALPVGYVRLSPLYDETADRCQARGWPVARVDGRHIEPMLDPDAVARAVEDVLARMGV